MYNFIFFLIYSTIFNQLAAISRKNNWKWDPPKPPAPRNIDNGKLSLHPDPWFLLWNERDETNIWEHSGLFEGDIVTYTERNGLIDDTSYWPNGIVPFYIEQKDFNDTQISIILKAIQEYHIKTCIRFRPYEKSDENWIVFKGNRTGCWSSVGMRSDGQVVNLNTPKCVRHGVVVHEILHALGFHHQQSSTDRDKYIKIIWENIVPERKHNFKKYDEDTVSAFGIEYDYTSVMHYSAKAFSKNKEPTIVPLMENVSIGQRDGLSEKDIIKLNKMYAENCNKKLNNSSGFEKLILELIDFFETDLYNFIFN